MADGTEGVGETVKGELTGGCNCGAVRYRIAESFRLPPYACHCTDCQTRTGSAFSEHMLVSENDIAIEGPLATGTMQQPSGAISTIHGCAECLARIYATNDQRGGLASVRCGTLDESVQIKPVAHFWVRSKQAWICLPDGATQMETQPGTGEEWLRILSQASSK